jgi:RNA polymerase sigma-70 factor (ECF subfamily)
MKNTVENRTEEELLRAFAAGDVNALETLLIQKRDWISAVARKIIRDPHLAEDAVQEALVRIFKNAGSFKGESKATTWLYRVITNSCIDLLRKVEKYSTESNIDFITSDEIPEISSPPTINNEDLYEALEQLPKDQKIAITLVNIEGYSVEEAAKIMETRSDILENIQWNYDDNNVLNIVIDYPITVLQENAIKNWVSNNIVGEVNITVIR